MSCFPWCVQYHRLLLLLTKTRFPLVAVRAGRPGLCGAGPGEGPAPSRLGRGVPGEPLSGTDRWRHGGTRVSGTISLPPLASFPETPRAVPRLEGLGGWEGGLAPRRGLRPLLGPRGFPAAPFPHGHSALAFTAYVCFRSRSTELICTKSGLFQGQKGNCRFPHHTAGSV